MLMIVKTVCGLVHYVLNYMLSFATNHHLDLHKKNLLA